MHGQLQTFWSHLETNFCFDKNEVWQQKRWSLSTVATNSWGLSRRLEICGFRVKRSFYFIFLCIHK